MKCLDLNVMYKALAWYRVLQIQQLIMMG